MKQLVIALAAISTMAAADIIGEIPGPEFDLPKSNCKLIIGTKAGRARSICSATVVGKNFILTARHCFEGLVAVVDKVKIECASESAYVDLSSATLTMTLQPLKHLNSILSQ